MMERMNKNKIALITGITGQDGAYLARFLLEKGYEVHGIKRRSSLFNTQRIDAIYQSVHSENKKFFLHYGDAGDSSNIIRLMQKIQPDEVYNLAAQSHVQVSFDAPEYTADVVALGTLRILEAVRLLGLEKKTRMYQASTSELFGLVQETPQRETTPFYPRSPYAVAKLYAYWIVVNYREAYGIYACNGILFNHESPLRGETFVTRKITRALPRLVLLPALQAGQNVEQCLHMGNINALRDWGHAHDYVRMMWLMLQQEVPDDFVIASGEQHSVREFIEIAADMLGITLTWHGTGVEEVGVVAHFDATKVEALMEKHVRGTSASSSETQDAFMKSLLHAISHNPLLQKGSVLVRIDPRYFRPTEVESLWGHAAKAKAVLGWEPNISFREMVREMVEDDFSSACQDSLCVEAGFSVPATQE